MEQRTGADRRIVDRRKATLFKDLDAEWFRFWQQRIKAIEASGWYFELHSEFVIMRGLDSGRIEEFGVHQSPDYINGRLKDLGVMV